MRATRLNLLLLTLCLPRVTPFCDFAIRRNKVANTWQSSSDSSAKCFNERTPDEENAVLSSSATSNLFFLSDSRARADGDFQWFVVQLKESVPIIAVIIKGPEVPATDARYDRAAGTEVWSTASSDSMFSGSNCNSGTLDRQFSAVKDSFSNCGIVTKDGLMNRDEAFAMNCATWTRQLVLRKRVGAAPNSDVMNFADLKLRMADFTIIISEPQIAAQSSRVTVNCSLFDITPYCPSPGTAQPGQLQLCLPDGSCSARVTAEIPSALPQHAGLYKCKLGSAERATSVIVLSISTQPDASGASLTVQCSLHCDAAQLCTDSKLLSKLQLCTPSGSCSNQDKMQVTSSTDLGNYKCKLDTAETETAVTVIPKSQPNVSVMIMNGDNCKSPSDVTVMFSSAAAQPPPEHRCSAVSEGGNVRILTQKSFSEKSEGFLSLWSFGADSSYWKDGWSSGSVECSSVQGSGPQKELKDSARWSCSQALTAPSPAVIATVVSVTSLITIIVVFIIFFLVMRWRRTQQQQSEAELEQPSVKSVFNTEPTARPTRISLAWMKFRPPRN